MENSGRKRDLRFNSKLVLKCILTACNIHCPCARFSLVTDEKLTKLPEKDEVMWYDEASGEQGMILMR